MFKALIFLVYIVVVSISSFESAIIECDYQYNSWSIVGSLYTCRVTKGITINSLDTAYVNSTKGTHQSGHTNDNVNFFYTSSVTISYFPRGLDAIFKNLIGIRFDSAGFKEIHQSDLKPFPKLREFLIYNGNQIEILEEGLFEFNPDLEYINLYINKITHIDPKVFDSLTKLRQLHLSSNTCISKGVSDRASVLNFITELKTKCNNSDYSSLEQKLKFLKSESKSLNLEDFKLELENLESKVNVSKFVNFYQTKLKTLKIILDEKSSKNRNAKLLNYITSLNNLTAQVSNEIENVKLCSKDNIAMNNEFYSELHKEVVTVRKTVESVDNKLEKLNATINNIKTSTSESESIVIAETINKAVEKIEKNLVEKMDENLKEIDKKVQEGEKRFNERTSKIMKVLKVVFDVSDMSVN